MSDLAITVSPGVLITLLSALGTAITGIGTFCGHMLINMNKMLTTIVKEHAVLEDRTEGRFEVLERDRDIASFSAGTAAFAGVKTGMKELEVRALVGLPREDWIKQVVQNNRVYSVWIYPKQDGGASAIYFDNGAVYHTNWNAAAPATTAAAGQ